MAFADLRDELLCSICLNIFTDPVNLGCGHNFCRGCIDQVLDTQDGSGVYSCPQCRKGFRRRPALKKNITLCNVVEHFQSTQQHQEEVTGIYCTYCVDSPVPAVRSCLLCEASLCDKHLKVHSKSPEHVLTDPSTNLENRKCPIHKKILEYYCTEDAACICVSCSLVGEHQGHRVEMLDEAFKKKKLRNVHKNLIKKREKTEEKVKSLQKRREKVKEKASEKARRLNIQFAVHRLRLNHIQKWVVNEISRQEEQLSLPLSDVIQKLENKKAELSRDMRHIEELCNMTDPLTVLQEPDTGDLCDPEEGGGDEDTGGHDGGDEDTGGHDGGDEDTGGHDGGDKDNEGHDGDDEDTGGHDVGDRSVKVISQLSSTLLAILRGLNVIFFVQGPADILLDVNTALNNLLISDDLKTVTFTTTVQDYPETAERFVRYPQVMSSRGFTSGRHYWDVEISGSESWIVGMCYPSTDRREYESCIGNNSKSWGLFGGQKYKNLCLVRHNRNWIHLSHQISSNRFRIYVDYEAGQLSFYELCDPIRHLHTFTATFTEPLHAALYIYDGSIMISGRSSCEEPSS